MKWALIGVLTLGALGAWAMSLSAAGSLKGEVKPLPMPTVVMRPLPPLSGGPIAVAMRDAPPPPSKPEPAKPEPAKPEPEPKAEAPKPEPKPEPAAPKEPKDKPEPKEKPEPAKPKEPREPKPAPAPKEPKETREPKEEAPKPKPPPEEKETSAPPPPAASASGEGVLNLKASDTAEIVVDGRKIGPSPRLGYKVKSGKHKIRFDCYDENGNLKPGKVQTVEVKADQEHEVDYECPFSQ